MALNNFQVSSLFAKLPEDNHFTKTEYRKLAPRTFFKDNISFELESLCFPYLYQLSDAMMEVRLKITKSDGSTMPEPSVEVGPVNNILYSLFESLEMRINGIGITQSENNYPYRCQFHQHFRAFFSYEILVPKPKRNLRTKNARVNR